MSRQELLKKIFPKHGFERIYLWCIFAFAFVVAFDLITKALAEYYIAPGSVISFIPGFMNLTLYYNSGMAFGMGADKPVLMGVIILLTIPIMLAFIYVIYRMPKRYNVCKVMIACITGGAFANFVDRVYYYILNLAKGNIAKIIETGNKLYYEGGVRDFMDVSSIGFGVCNIADYFVSIGGVVLGVTLLILILTEKSSSKDK